MSIDRINPGLAAGSDRLSDAFRPIRKRPGGLSIIELIVTLLIVVIVLTAVLGIFDQTSNRMRYLTDILSRQHQAQSSLDNMAEDIFSAAVGKLEISVEQETVGWMKTAHLKIISRPIQDQQDQQDQQEQGNGGYTQIDWIAAPRMEENDLVLFRREQIYPVEKPALYIPVCENLNAFEINVMDQNGKKIDDPADMKLMNVRMEIFIAGAGHADRLINLERTVCINRFGTPGAAETDKADETDPNSVQDQTQQTTSDSDRKQIKIPGTKKAPIPTRPNVKKTRTKR